MALCDGPPLQNFWHWRHQHWRVATGSPVIDSVTPPQAQRPV
jgi:hypothetical protein